MVGEVTGIVGTGNAGSGILSSAFLTAEHEWLTASTQNLQWFSNSGVNKFPPEFEVLSVHITSLNSSVSVASFVNEGSYAATADSL